MALDKFQPYLFVSAGEQSNKYLTPAISPDGMVSFQAQRAQDLTGLTIRIDPIQEGSGDPSPDNIRPISGRTGMTVTVQSGETQNEYPITWQTEAGTVYGGTLDVVSGVLTVTAEYIQLTADMWTVWNNTDKAAFTNAEYFGRTITMCDSLAPNSTGIYVRQADGRIRAIAPWAASCTSLKEFKTALADNPPINVVIPLSTPQTYQLTPTKVRTIAGFNQIYSDAGPVIDIKF